MNNNNTNNNNRKRSAIFVTMLVITVIVKAQSVTSTKGFLPLLTGEDLKIDLQQLAFIIIISAKSRISARYTELPAIVISFMSYPKVLMVRRNSG